MYGIKFYNFADALQHTILQANIVDVQLSAKELESEQPLFRTPQSATIICKNDTDWVFDNIVKMPKDNIADRDICKYYLAIEWNSVVIATMFILNDNQSSLLDSGLINIQCYDYTKLLEIYSDLEFTNSSKYDRISLTTTLTAYLAAIQTNLGLTLTPDIETVIFRDPVTLKRFATFNLDPDNKIGVLPPSAIRELNAGDDIVYDNTAVLHTSYAMGFRTASGDSGGTELQYPSMRMIALTIWEAWNAASTYSPLYGWDVRPKYYARLIIKRINFFNTCCPVVTDEVDMTGGWRFISPQFQSGTPRPVHLSSNTYGVDTNDNKSEDWRLLINQFNIFSWYMTGRQYAINSNQFAQTGGTSGQYYGITISLPVPVSGSYRVSTSESGANIFKDINILRTGNIAPLSFNLPESELRYMEVMRSMLRCLNQTVVAKSDGTILVYNRNREVDIDLVTPPVDIGNATIELLTANLSGRTPYGDIVLSNLLGDYSFLENRLTFCYKGLNTRRQIKLTRLTADGSLDVLSLISIKGQYYGYICSHQLDYRNARAEITVNLLELASIKFTVTHGGLPLPLATVSLKIRDNEDGDLWVSKLTDGDGETYFYNIPVSVIPYDYQISKYAYTTIKDDILIDDEIEFGVNKAMSVSTVGTPVITPHRTTGKPSLIELYTEDDLANIYYSTDGADPVVGNPNTTKYESPFYIYVTKTVKAIAVVEYEELTYAESVVATVADISTAPVLTTPSVKRIYDPDDKEAILIALFTNYPEANIYYTLDGTDPETDGLLYTGILKLEKEIELRGLRVKAYFGEVESGELIYHVDEDSLIRTGDIVAGATDTQIFIMPDYSYDLMVTVIGNTHHKEAVMGLGVDVELLASMVRKFNIHIANLSIGTGALESAHHVNNSELSPDTYGKIVRYEDGDYDSESNVSGVLDYMPVTITANQNLAGNVELNITIYNGLDVPVISNDLTDPEIQYKIVIEMIRKDFNLIEVV